MNRDELSLEIGALWALNCSLVGVSQLWPRCKALENAAMEGESPVLWYHESYGVATQSRVVWKCCAKWGVIVL